MADRKTFFIRIDQPPVDKFLILATESEADMLARALGAAHRDGRIHGYEIEYASNASSNLEFFARVLGQRYGIRFPPEPPPKDWHPRGRSDAR